MRQMRRTMTVFAIVVAGSATARGAERDFSVAGTSLGVASPCAARVTIDPDPSLDGSVRVVATASHAEEIAQLAVATRAGGAAVGRADPERECWKPDGDASWSPTLVLAIRVPPGTPVSVDEGGAADYAIGAIGGPLSADVSGAVTLAATRVTSLSLDLSGKGRIKIGAEAGPAVVRSSGHATVTIGRAAAPTLRVDMSGAGTVTVAGGTVGSLSVEDSGAARVDVGGTTGDATLSLSGAGGVRIARLTGALSKQVSGVGTIDVGR